MYEITSTSMRNEKFCQSHTTISGNCFYHALFDAQIKKRFFHDRLFAIQKTNRVN